jgi:hypothetical protein
MTKESSIKQLKRIKQDMTHADDVNALDFAIRYLKNKTLEKIRAEIDRQQKWLLQAGYTAYNVDIAFDAIKSVVAESEEV